MADINYYLLHLYNEETHQFEASMYTNLADNVLMDVTDEETVKDVIEKIHINISKKADLDENKKIKLDQLPDSLKTEINISDYVSSKDDNDLITDEDGKLYIPPVELPPNRDFIESPIDLETETMGVLTIDKVDTSFLTRDITADIVKFEDGETLQDKLDSGDLTGDQGVQGTPGKSAYELAFLNGFTGTEEEWLDSLKGDVGLQGQDGKSAYEAAVEDGFIGDESEWLVSLKGTDGKDGQNGKDGTDGQDGKSAYDMAVETGFQGTEEEWLDSLNGADGKDGTEGKSAFEIAVEKGFVGTESEWLASLKGTDGINGTDGQDGESGVSVKIFEVPTSAWEASGTYSNYIYQADVTVDGLSETDTVRIDLDVPSAILATSALVLSSAETFDGVVRLYSRKIPGGILKGNCNIIKVVS